MPNKGSNLRALGSFILFSAREEVGSVKSDPGGLLRVQQNQYQTPSPCRSKIFPRAEKRASCRANNKV